VQSRHPLVERSMATRHHTAASRRGTGIEWRQRLHSLGTVVEPYVPEATGEAQNMEAATGTILPPWNKRRPPRRSQDQHVTANGSGGVPLFARSRFARAQAASGVNRFEARCVQTATAKCRA
jgi:hypothetical protein